MTHIANTDESNAKMYAAAHIDCVATTETESYRAQSHGVMMMMMRHILPNTETAKPIDCYDTNVVVCVFLQMRACVSVKTKEKNLLFPFLLEEKRNDHVEVRKRQTAITRDLFYFNI